jgi:hypothetical protein
MPTGPTTETFERVQSVLDRASLIQLARGGGGDYFEIGRGSDRDLAFSIIDRLRRRADDARVVESFEELYWHFLAAAALILALGTVLLPNRTELVWHAAGAAVVVLLLVIAL